MSQISSVRMVRPAPADDAALRAAAGAAAGQARRRFAMGASSNARAAGREPRLPPARPSGGRTASRGDRPVPPNAPDRPSAARCRAAAARALHLSASLTTMARSKKPAPPPPPLGELEAEVMEHVWERGESSVRAAMEALNALGECLQLKVTLSHRPSKKGRLPYGQHRK